jgi:hypothetical protein
VNTTRRGTDSILLNESIPIEYELHAGKPTVPWLYCKGKRLAEEFGMGIDNY